MRPVGLWSTSPANPCLTRPPRCEPSAAGFWRRLAPDCTVCNERVGSPAAAQPPTRLAKGRNHYLLFARAGTLPPFLRALDRPMAIACLRLVTFLPDLPLLSFPSFFSCIAFLTSFCAFGPYFAMMVLLSLAGNQRWDGNRLPDVAANAVPGARRPRLSLLRFD